MVREVLRRHATGKATGVHYIDKKTRRDAVAKARVVILAASTCETARILLNSKSRDSAGLANSSGTGRQEPHGQRRHAASARTFPRWKICRPTTRTARAACTSTRPWWLVREHKKLGFPRGYHIEMGGGRQMPTMSSLSILDTTSPGIYGSKLKEEARRYYGASFSFSGRGEMIPNKDCYCELDPTRRRSMGHSRPALPLEMERPRDQAGRAHAEHLRRIARRQWAARRSRKTGRDAIQRPGEIIHEVGTARMGAKAGDSVTNQYCQTWDVKNLFLMDGAVAAEQSRQEPHAHHPRPRLAQQRVADGGDEKGKCMNARSSTEEHRECAESHPANLHALCG